MSDDKGFIWDKKGFKNSPAPDNRGGRARDEEDYTKHTDISGQVSISQKKSGLNDYKPTGRDEKKKGARVSTSLAYQTLPKEDEEELPLLRALNQEQGLRNALIENNISEIGANLTVGEWQALIAIPELLETSGAYRRADEEFKKTNDIRPQEIVISLQDYLQAYGVTKQISSREKLETGGGYQIKEAVANLVSLTKPVAQVWTWTYDDAQGKKHKIKERIVGGLVSAVGVGYKDLTTGEFTQISKDDPDIDDTLISKAKYIRIQPAKIFFSRSFLNLPRGIIEEVREYLKSQDSSRKITETHYNMAIWLALQAHDGHSMIDKPYKALLANLGQKKDLRTRNAKRAEKRVDKVFKDYEATGAVISHDLYQHGFRGKSYKIKIDDKKIRGEQDEAGSPKKPKTKRRKK